MRKFPIVVEGEWLVLTYEEAETREEALMNAASKWVKLACEAAADDQEPLKLDPEGIQGSGSPSISIRVLNAENELASVWSVPDVFPTMTSGYIP